jgi:hypothetical protein
MFFVVRYIQVDAQSPQSVRERGDGAIADTRDGVRETVYGDETGETPFQIPCWLGLSVL